MSCRRALAVALVAAWLLPGAMALAIGLHLDDHHGDAGGHHDALRELSAALEHGHSHALDAPAHEHHAVRERAAEMSAAPLAVAAVAALVAPPAPAVDTMVRSRRDRPPPVPLFTLHCALLS